MSGMCVVIDMNVSVEWSTSGCKICFQYDMICVVV